MKQLLSRAYRNQLIELHGADAAWGTTGSEYFLEVMKAAKDDGCKSLLDYGCGKGYLVAMIKDYMVSKPEKVPEDLVRVEGYDPAVKDYLELPAPADLIVSTDVFEHIEPENLDTVLGHIAGLMLISGFFVIFTGKAKAILPDGRNAHLIQEGEDFWAAKLKEHWPSVETSVDSRGRVHARVWK